MSCRCLSILFLVVSCATLASPETRTDRRVLGTTEETVPTHLELTVKDVTWQGSRLTASLGQQQLCQQTRVDKVSYQTIAFRKATGVAPTILLGAGGIVVGGASLIASSRLSDNSGSVGVSPAGFAALAGLTMLSTGIAALCTGVGTAMDARDKPQGPPNVGDERTAIAPPVSCGPAAPAAGEIQLRFADKVALQMPVTGPRLDLDVESRAGALCIDDANEHIPLVISWRSGDSEQEISRYDAGDCIRAQRVESRLAHAREMISSATSAERLLAVEPMLRAAERAFDAISATYPRRETVHTELEKARETRRDAATKLIDDVLNRIPIALAESGAIGIDAAVDALDLAAETQGRQADAMTAVLRTFAKSSPGNEMPTLSALSGLLLRRGDVRGCLTAGSCPAGLTQAEAREIVAPVASGLRLKLQARMHDLERRLMALKARRSARVEDDVQATVDALRTTAVPCQVVIAWDADAKSSCEAAAKLLSDAGETLSTGAEDQ